MRRTAVLDDFRARSGRELQVEALQLLAGDDCVVLAIRDRGLRELAGVELDGQLFLVFTLRDGRIAHFRDYARRADALDDAGLREPAWH
jgi:hypothetical protein